MKKSKNKRSGCYSELVFSISRQWATLHLDPLSKKNVKELFRAELALFDIRLSQEEETSILEHCQTDDTCAPLFTMVLVRHTVW